MTPTYDELLRGVTTWDFCYSGVNYQLAHHSFRNGSEYPGAKPYPGTWCYYLMIPEQIYLHRWNDFACPFREDGYGFDAGPAFHECLFQGGITYAASIPYYSRHEKRWFDLAKVGCDYAHLWDEERGYPDTFESVKRDAQRTIVDFLDAYPDRRWKSGWSNRWGKRDKFYTARNGQLVHKEDEIPMFYEGWQPHE